MASVRQEVHVALTAALVWAAVREVGDVHRRLLPGRVLDTRLEGDVRLLTLPDGHVVRELIVSVDDEARRLAYAVVAGSRMPLVHHHAVLEVHEAGVTACRLVWVTDVLPHALASEVEGWTRVGLVEMRDALERSAEG